MRRCMKPGCGYTRNPDDANYCCKCGYFFRTPPQAGLDRNGDVIPISKKRRDYMPRDLYAVQSEEIQRLLQPLVDLNGYQWLADRMEVDWSTAKALLKPGRYIGLSTIDKYLQKLGLTHALSDSTLNIVKNPRARGQSVS